MRWLLLSIKKILYKIGIDISFVRKKELHSALDMNDVDAANKAWSNEKISKRFLSKSVLGRFQETLSILKDHDIEFTNKSVIDIGCGNGMLLKFLSENFNVSSQTGMEYSEAAIEVAARINPEAEYIVHDINLSYPVQYEAVICTEVLEHILHPGNAFKNLLEMLPEGGILLITVPNGRFDTFSGHVNFWSPESWDIFVAENSGGLKYSTGAVEKVMLYAIVYMEEKVSPQRN